MTLRNQADQVAAAGRYGDSVLVHMSPEEVGALDQLAMASGIAALPRNPHTGYPEAFSLGGLLKGIGSLAAGTLGTAFLGPLGGALGSGLFTGLTEQNLKKGLFAGLTAYMGGKALDAVADTGRAAAMSGAGKAGSDLTSQELAKKAGQLSTRRGWGYFGDVADAFGSRVAGEAALSGVGNTLGTRGMMMALPVAGEVKNSINADEREIGSIAAYERQVADARRDYESRFGRNPYASMYAGRYRGYAEGGLVTPDQRDALDSGVMRLVGSIAPNLGGRATEQEELLASIRDGEGNIFERLRGGMARRAADRRETETKEKFPHLVSNAPPQGFIPGYMPEFMYMTPPGVQPQNPAQGFTPYGDNPFAVPGIEDILNQGRGNFLAELGYQPPQIPPTSQPPGGGGYPGMGMGDMVGYAQGGMVNPAGGMGDGIVAPLEGGGAARLSPGEFVVPADVVSMLGDGDTATGAEILEAMMGRIRQQKTGSPRQLPPTNLAALPG